MKKHMHLSVIGALANWKDKEWIGVFKDDDGKPIPPREAKLQLLDGLSQGKKVIPLGTCEGFDHSGGGCPGHIFDEEATK